MWLVCLGVDLLCVVVVCLGFFICGLLACFVCFGVVFLCYLCVVWHVVVLVCFLGALVVWGWG